MADTLEQLRTDHEDLKLKFTSLETTLTGLLTAQRYTPPLGSILISALEVPPRGYLPCDGAVYKLDEHPELRELFQGNGEFPGLGNRYGGDGETTFGVPDPRAAFLRFLDQGKNRDAGRQIGSIQNQSTAAPTRGLTVLGGGGHSHGLSGDGSHGHGFNPGFALRPIEDGKADGGGDRPAPAGGPQVVGQVTGGGGHTHSVTGVGDHAHGLDGWDGETRPYNVAFAAFIKF